VKALKVLLLLIGLSISSASAEVSRQTPRGKLKIHERVLYLNDEMVLPKIEGDLSLTIERNFAYKGGNAILLANNSGGTACPSLYKWLLVLPDSILQTPEFGTCSDLHKVFSSKGKLVVRLPSFVESRDVIFVFDGKRLTEDGQEVR
jgi:hypothetical protein